MCSFWHYRIFINNESCSYLDLYIKYIYHYQNYKTWNVQLQITDGQKFAVMFTQLNEM